MDQQIILQDMEEYSKTINIKNNFDIKLIPEIIVNAYQNNLKCVTIYRDKSRENQPMNKILCETC